MWVRKLGLFITRIVFAIIYRVEIVGRENIPKKGAAIICSNHTSLLDMFLLGYKIDRWIYWMAKEELFKIPVLKKILVIFGAFPVKRGKGDVGSIKASLNILKEQHILGIFPEGTRVKGKDRSKIKIRSGAALIALNAQVPIIPAAIIGNYKPFSRMKVVFGKPFFIDSSVKDSNNDKKHTREELHDISQSIMNKIYSLMEE
jgi:1-acyl-sn-glycerol-3-phosphate acyltransferase